MNGGRPENRNSILIPPATVIPLQMVSDITIRLDELIQNVTSDRENTIQWLTEMGLLADTQTCEKCNNPMKIYNRYCCNIFYLNFFNML